jgi:hypothetical protein
MEATVTAVDTDMVTVGVKVTQAVVVMTAGNSVLSRTIYSWYVSVYGI